MTLDMGRQDSIFIGSVNVPGSTYRNSACAYESDVSLYPNFTMIIIYLYSNTNYNGVLVD